MLLFGRLLARHRPMDIELLKTFLEVKKTRHFGRAAENLYLTQAAVSARIKQLETTLGTPLFTRYRNNLQLTQAGDRLTCHAESILISWDRAKSELLLKKSQAQALVLGATNGLWDLLLQDALNQIHAQMPSVAMRAEAHSQEVLIRRLMERNLDLALVYEPAKLSELVSSPIAEAHLILISSSPEENALAALDNRYVAVDWGTSFEINFSQHFKPLSPPVLHTTLARIALDFILTHGGCAYLPSRMVFEHLGKTLHRVMDAPQFTRPIYACYHSENRNVTLINKVHQIIESCSQ